MYLSFFVPKKSYVAHIPPLKGWYSRDSLCYGVGARVEYINAKMQKCKKGNPNSPVQVMRKTDRDEPDESDFIDDFPVATVAQ